MKKSSHDIERFRQAATFLIQTFAVLARAQFCLRQKPVWLIGSGIQKQKCANSCAANQRPAPKSSLDFCAAKCRPSFTGGKSRLKNVEDVSPSAPKEISLSKQKLWPYYSNYKNSCQRTKEHRPRTLPRAVNFFRRGYAGMDFCFLRLRWCKAPRCKPAGRRRWCPR